MAKQLMNRRDLAAALEVTTSTVSRWESDGMPAAKKAGRGRETKFDFAKCRAWRDAADASGAIDGVALRHSRARKELAQAIESEQRVALKAGKLVDAEEIRQAIANDYSIVRTKLLGLPRKMKARLPHLTLVDVQEFDAGIREALEALAVGDDS